MAILSCNFKAFKFPKESGFEQFYNDYPEIKQERALIENLQKVLDFTYHNNEYIMKGIMGHFKGN